MTIEDKIISLMNARISDPIKMEALVRNTLDIDSKVIEVKLPLLEAVGQADGRALAVIYNHKHLKTAKTVLVGKGVVYDSGGYNIKTRGMDGMFSDKKGAILVAAHCAVNKTTPGVVFYTNNLINEHSYLPGSIIESYNGTNVLITNTDAEGRLGLADCLSYVKEVNPKAHAITVATLTGAAVAFTGVNTFGLVHSTKHKKLYQTIVNLKGFKMWPAPLHEDYDAAVDTKVFGADIQNSDMKPGGGSQKAFSFLKYFHNNLTHFDIAALMSDQNDNGSADGFNELGKLVKLL